MTIQWTGALSVSNTKIDAEHKRLFELVDVLKTEITSQQRSQEELVRITELILEVKIPHSANEERILIEKHAITEAHELHQHHLQVIDKIKQLLEEIQGSPFVRVWVACGRKIESLLTDHIMNVDTKYRDYLRTA